MTHQQKHLLTPLLLIAAMGVHAQSPMAGRYANEELNIHMRLNLGERNIPVPGLELDSCYGWLQGNLNGAWLIMRVKQNDERKVVVRAVSERGADAQDLELTPTPDGGITLRQTGSSYIKGVKNRRYVKLPKTVTLSPRP